MPKVTHQKCACDDCLCIIDIGDAVKKDDRNYCSDACANGHPEGFGCGHTGCKCNG